MIRTVLIDEFHVSLYVPRRLDPHAIRAVRRTLTGARFRAALVRAVRDVVRRQPPLAPVTVAVTR